VGERGARTRERIVAETLALFARKGFHETTVRDISNAADVSRATLYQYFESKEEIFVELLDECGGALLGVMRRIGPLGPTAQGFQNLCSWLTEWTEVYDKYGTMFVQWANVDLPGTAVRGLVSNFLRSYNLRIANRFRESGLVGLDSREAAIVTTSIIHRFNYLRFVSRSPQPPAAAAVRGVAVVLQSILFPATPASAMAIDRSAASTRRAPRSESNPLLTTRRKRRGGAPVAGLTVRSAATVNRIMEAGALCFSESGYYRANVDDIVTRAGFARGTFYKYFDEKLDLLLALSDECEDLMYDLQVAFAKVPPGIEGHEERRAWMADYLVFRARYIGVMRTWIDRSPNNPALSRARDRVVKMVSAALQTWLDAAPLGDVLDVRAAEVMLIGVLERLPDAMADNSRRTRPAQLAELMATVVERAIFRVEVES
jgi:AcrR family transcriptional regulator